MLRNSQAIANIGQASAEIWQSYKRFINTGPNIILWKSKMIYSPKYNAITSLSHLKSLFLKNTCR